MVKLRKRYRAALKNTDMQKAFDELWPAWSTEQGAMIYAEVLSSIDLLLLTATIDNRREIKRLRQENTKLKRHISELIGVSDTED
jgi:hypothetical protein